MPKGNSKNEKKNLIDAELASMAKEINEAPIEEGGAPEWMTTFSDLMTLLLCFFILMFAMSEVKQAKFSQAADSLREGLGTADTESEDPAQMTGAASAADTTGASLEKAVEDMMEKIKEKLENFVSEHELKNTLDVSQDDNGVSLSIQDVVLFRPGSAFIESSSEWVLDTLAILVEEINLPLIVEGHTDNSPIRTAQFPSNWELSAVRAAGVVRELVERNFDPNAIYIEGYGHQRPIESNNTREGRATNRRVNLLYSRENIREKVVEELIGPPK